MVADTLRQVELLLGAQRFEAAAQALLRAAAADEPEAIELLAHWRISGAIVRRDLAAARSLLGRAGTMGRSDAALLHASFLASGTGGPSDWAAARRAIEALAADEPRASAQRDLVAAMELGEDGFP